jgi:hypothetical protein
MIAMQQRPETTRAPDLRVHPPRPMEATLAGYAWLPRMIDKARAHAAGSAGTFVYPCPIDRTCLGLLGLDAPTFSRVADAFARDGAILAELARRGIPAPADAWFDPVALEHRLGRGAAR